MKPRPAAPSSVLRPRGLALSRSLGLAAFGFAKFLSPFPKRLKSPPLGEKGGLRGMLELQICRSYGALVRPNQSKSTLPFKCKPDTGRYAPKMNHTARFTPPTLHHAYTRARAIFLKPPANFAD